MNKNSRLAPRIALSVVPLALILASSTYPFAKNHQKQEARIPVSVNRNASDDPQLLADYRERGKQADEALASGNEQLAEQLFQGLLADYPKDLMLMSVLADLYDRQHRDREALEEYRKILDGFPGVSASIQTDPLVLNRFADLSAKYGSVEEARVAYQKAVQCVELEPDQAPIVATGDSLDQLRSAALIAVGMEYGYEGEYRLERSSFLTASQLDSRSWRAHLAMAAAWRRIGKWDDANQEMARAAALVPPASKHYLTEGAMRSRLHAIE